MGERAEVDFDHHSDQYFATKHTVWAEARSCPVAFNPTYGGFWVVSGYDEVAAVARDEATFTSTYVPGSPDGLDYLGIMGIPRLEEMSPAGIAESTETTHVALRRLLNPFLLPPAVAARRPFLEASAAWFLDQRIEAGAMDLVTEFTSAVPAVMTLTLIGLPPERWPDYGEVFHATVSYPRGSPEYEHAAGLIPGMVEHLLGQAAQRRRDPRPDILSGLATMEVEGRPLTDDEIVSVLWNLIGGGLDTTTSLTSLALYHLDLDRHLRRRIADDLDLLVPATEEYLRYWSVNETLTRTVTRDVELGGQQLSRGDHLMIGWLSANFDEAVFDRPGEVIVDRTPNPHLAFGVGPRRCIGMHLARAQFLVMMREVLIRIPDYEVDRGAIRFYQGNPELTGVVSMPVRFSPGPRTGVTRPF
ncbi:MAG TPA: cytochrome P450 [Acidimicrobiales bacterium]|nr:cytochrome P450 [Acidimicrobiales bacterium]